MSVQCFQIPISALLRVQADIYIMLPQIIHLLSFLLSMEPVQSRGTSNSRCNPDSSEVPFPQIKWALSATWVVPWDSGQTDTRTSSCLMET